MLTPQEVSARSFTKAVMGGYNMTMVDEFLDELTDDYTSLYKENASLKAKLKVLVEKVEEYRSTEDAMRAALLAAQRMADTIVQEAQAKGEEIKKQAGASAREQLEQSRRELAQTQQRLRQGQQELERFIADGKDRCGRMTQFLDQLSEIVPEGLEEAPADVPQVEQIEKNVMGAALAGEPAKEKTPPPAPPAAMPRSVPTATPEPVLHSSAPTTKISVPVSEPAAPPPPAHTPAPAPAHASTPVPEPPAAESKPDLDATRRVNLDDLKFGPKYRGETR